MHMARRHTRHRRGSIRRRGSQWQVDITLGARRVRRSAPSREDAEALLAELARQPRSVPAPAPAAPVRRSAPSVPEVLERYLERTRLHCRPSTVRSSDAAAERLSRFFGELP
jgi:hypothetical protein